ncbi:MAG: hypothetical protein WAO98_01475, partial [Alphaproteobacteria bacterium]
MDVYDIIGLMGVGCSLFAYGKVQWRRDYAKHLSFSALNVASSCLIGISFVKHWNMASFTLNAVWGLISIYGVYRCLK